MSKPNLFFQLEGYARENFTTETLAYILRTDGKVRKAFLRLLLDQRQRLLATFEDCDIETQVSHDAGRPDLEITSGNGASKKIYVEIKTQSPEGKNQLKRYLKRGHVAYLTPLRPPVQIKSSRFLGHFFWHEVYSMIKSVTGNNALYKQFLEYLEARHMGSIKPITSTELRSAAHAVDFLQKSQALVADVRKQIEDKWRRQFGKNVGGKEVCDDFSGGWFHYWWFRAKDWKREGRNFYLCIGTGLEGERNQAPVFYLNVGSTRRKFWPVLETDLSKQLRELCKLGWKKADPSDDEWGYYKFFPLCAGDIDSAARKQAGNVRRAMKDLQRLRIITMIENRI